MSECLMCGKEYKKTIKLEVGLLEGKGRFCSDECFDEWWVGQPEHPVLPKVRCVVEGAKELRETRKKLCILEKADPWEYGNVPEHWEWADEEWQKGLNEMLVSGGNRSGKTLWAARKCVQTLLSKDNASVLCCHTSNATSVTVQQPAIFQYLPIAMKQTKKSKVAYLNYTRKNGFTDASFILPNGSRCDFINYTQSENTIEGREADLVWCDELVPQNWVETLRYRLVTRRGKLLITQTPIEGVASVYKEFVSGGIIEKWATGKLLEGRTGVLGWDKGKVPRKLRQVKNGRVTLFFHSEDNPYNPMEEMANKLVAAPMGQILTRAYGWATSNLGKAFPRFRNDIHIVEKDKYKDKLGSLYMIVDPAGARNWFCLWLMAYEDGTKVVVKEYPDMYTHGEWAISSEKADGRMGPGQTMGSGAGVDEYRSIFKEIEDELGYGSPVMRLIDPRSGGTVAMSEAGGTTLIDLLATGGVMGEGMAFMGASNLPVDQRIATINSELNWDAEKDMSVINQPKLYIDSNCHNLIWCMAEHTGRDGQKGASKDPIDCLGMLLVSNMEYVGGDVMNSVSGGSY